VNDVIELNTEHLRKQTQLDTDNLIKEFKHLCYMHEIGFIDSNEYSKELLKFNIV
jgi:hypothetical protein